VVPLSLQQLPFTLLLS